jgi:hypothetical protein
MRFGLQLTMDGLVRALRTKLHELGEDPQDMLRRAEQRNETALTLLWEESRRVALEAGDEFRR